VVRDGVRVRFRVRSRTIRLSDYRTFGLSTQNLTEMCFILVVSFIWYWTAALPCHLTSLVEFFNDESSYVSETTMISSCSLFTDNKISLKLWLAFSLALDFLFFAPKLCCPQL